MIIIQKNYSGGNGRGTLEYHLNNTEETEQPSPAIDYSPVRDPYKDKDEYLSTHFGEEKAQEVAEEEPGIVLKPGQKDPRILDLKPAGIAAAKTKVRVPKTIKNPVPETVEFNPQADIRGEEAPEEIKAGMSGAAKAGLIGAGVAALGAGSYAAYKALKKRKAKKAVVKAEVDKFLNNKYKTE